MLHINGRPKLYPMQSPSLCSRRHKGMLQTSVILALIVCIGYGFYLYNLLQVKVKFLDTKALRHQSQQQSLSSQLQAVYEDRARLEKAAQKSKNELQKLKEENEGVIQSMLIEHQDKNEALDRENKVVTKLYAEVKEENQRLKTKYEKVYKEHDDLKKKHQAALSEHASAVNEAHVELQNCKYENEAIQRLRGDLQGQVQQTEEKYEGLKSVLNAVPVNAVNFEHPDIANLHEYSIELLKESLGEARGETKQWCQERPAENPPQQPQVQQQVQRNEPPNLPQGDNRLPVVEQHQVEQLQQQNMQPDGNIDLIDICALIVDQGPCHGPGGVRFAFHPDTKECSSFIYGGCGGNKNNFKTAEECMSVCNDPQRRYLPIQEQLAEEGQQDNREVQPHGAVVDDANIHEIQQNGDNNIHELSPPGDEAAEGDDAADGDDATEGDDAAEGDDAVEVGDEGEDGVPDQQDDDERQMIKDEEMRAKREEEAARQELKKQEEDLNHDPNENGDDDLQKLKENSKLQLELAHDMQADMEKMIHKQMKDDEKQQDQDQIEAGIEEDEEDPGREEYNEEEEEEEGGDDGNGEEFAIDEGGKDSDDVQVAMPPAAQVAGHDPEAVMNAPPAQQDGIDSEEINGQNVYLGQDGDRDENDGEQEYNDDNQQEEGDAGVENGEDEREDENYNQEEGGVGEEDKVDDNGGEEDDYADDEEDPQEKKQREWREYKRQLSDNNFKARNEVQGMIPIDAMKQKEM